jgi:hypothetical protein
MAEDVLLVRQDDAVTGQMILPPGELERAEPGRARVALGRRVQLRRLAEHRGEVDQPGALNLRLEAAQLHRVSFEVPLHEVGRQVRVLLEHERDGAGQDRGGLGGTGAAEVAVADPRLRVTRVDERIRNP